MKEHKVHLVIIGIVLTLAACCSFGGVYMLLARP
jgi:hypothetical protein